MEGKFLLLISLLPLLGYSLCKKEEDVSNRVPRDQMQERGYRVNPVHPEVKQSLYENY